MLAQTVSKNCIKKPLSIRFRIGVIGGLVLAACSLNVWAEPATNRYLQSRLIQADEAGNVVIQTRKGDSLRVIAQQYSRVNNIPFARALEILQTTNASQFPNNDADQMLIGTRLVLPAKNQNSEPIAAVVSPPASVTETTSSGSASNPSLTTETTSNTPPSDSAQKLERNNDNTTVATTLEQKSHPLRAQLNRLEDKVQSQVEGTVVAPYYAKLKSWFLAIPASLWLIIIPTIFLVWVVARLTRRSTEPANSFESKHDAVQPTASPVEAVSEHMAHTNATEPNATPEIQTARVPNHVIEGWMESESTERAGDEPKTVSAAPQDTDVSSAHDTQATPEAAAKPHHSVETSSQSFVENTQTETGTNQDLNKLKQVLNGLTADQLDLRSQKPANRATQFNETDTEKTTDVNGLLQQYAERAAVKSSEHTIHYGVFKERARLQKWMHALAPEQLLTHAQSAHQQGQGEVAQYILNEVLLRGDAAQCTQALDLRNAWLTQMRRPSDNEAR